jgi:hypothetical protein
VTFDITQDGNTFTWVATHPSWGQSQSHGAGTLKGNDIEATWTPPSPGSSKGTITAAHGRAIRVQWVGWVSFIR